MHLLGTITSVHFIEKERQHAQGQFQIPKHVCNTSKWLEYICWPFNKSGRIVCHICCMREKGVNEVRFVKYYSKCQDEKKLLTFQLFCRTDQYCYYTARGQFFTCIWKRCLEASFELSSIADYGWDQDANICWIKEPFPKDREDILMTNTMWMKLMMKKIR